MVNDNTTLLLIDDDEVWHLLAKRALAHINSPLKLAKAVDGLDGLDALRGSRRRSRIDGPRVILLDLRMPRMSGLEFLEELRRDASVRDAVVFALSTSDQAQDVETAFRWNVAGYFVKPGEFLDFVEVIKLIDQYCRLSTFAFTMHALQATLARAVRLPDGVVAYE